MKPKKLLTFISLFAALHCSAQSMTAIPHLAMKNGRTQLIVDGKSFIITGGELGNSAASSTAYMKPLWVNLEKLNLNTVIAPVYWELMEPQENRFDFKLVDDLLTDARKHHMKLVLLWFGTWKNSMSCYVPEWMKTNQDRFPRTQNTAGTSAEIITPFSKNALEADKKAFVKLMQHLKSIDANNHTVLMVQVENEIGMLPEARDHSAKANVAFAQPVPAALIDYLETNKDKLLPEIKEKWQANGVKTTGTWEDIFGKGIATDEIFMAWYYGVYVEEIVKAGKNVYPLPMYLNAALNAPGRKPGEYPSAGPLPHLMDIWKAAVPSVDMLSPDFYNPDFKHWNDLYTRNSNVLFIPEHRFEAGVDAKAFYAIGHYHAIGFSPFAIESKAKPWGESLSKAYAIIHQLQPEISNAKPENVEGVLLNKTEDSVQLKMGAYLLTVKHDFTLSWSVKPKDGDWPLVGGIIVAVSENEFYVGGTGIVITFKPLTKGERAGILRVDEGTFVNGVWTPGRRLNGDEDHQGRHLSIPTGDYNLQRIKLYNYH
jgi:beta-galactosidase GanA